jgi:hypothetical protein
LEAQASSHMPETNSRQVHGEFLTFF